MPNKKNYLLDLQLFAEDKKEEDVVPPTKETNVDPNAPTVKALSELKKNSVPKSVYDELENKYKDALDAIVNGNSDKPDTVVVENKETVDELRKDLFDGKKRLSNLEYWKKALKLREELMARGETDPFLPVGAKIVPEQSDIDAANRVAQVVQECIEFANGDSAIFTNELQRRTIDTLPRR